MTLRAEGARLLGGLLLFALLAAGTASPGLDLQESRGRAGKIRVRPRGNLWATGGQHNGQGSSLALGHPHLPPSVPSAPPCPVQDRPRSRLTTTRGSLWLLGDEAGRFRIFTPELTGHFMGKKSLEAPSPSLLGTVPQISPRAQRLQRSHDLLGILRLKKAVGPGPGGPAPHTQHDAWRTESTQETGTLASPRAPRQHLLLAHLLSPPRLTEAAGANAAEVMPLMRKIQQRGSDCAHPGKVLHGTLVGVPPGCKSWAQISVTPFL
ncbi:neuromedin-B isoform X2 [Manis javanica]|uniref:neuromedin-B isoform X2 n=1 Tax=Manis javanica TaxID=9974 RepID=UPI003C6D8940